VNHKWSEIVLKKIYEYQTLMFEAERYIWAHPETGFKEWEAHSYLKEKFNHMGFDVTEAGDITGFFFDIDTGKSGPTVAILGELDALILPEHPECNPETGAVHACGHHCQSSSLLGIAGVLSKPDVLAKLCGKIRIMAVPAEELIGLGERVQMKNSGKIKYISGKSEFMRRGHFDGVDIAIMLHSTGGEAPGLGIIGGTSGLVAKRIVFEGSKNVAGARPLNGNNALYAAQTAMSAINALRETFPHEHNVRVQSIIAEGGESVQLMPSEVVIESNVRAYGYDVLKSVNDKVNRAYAGAAVSLGTKVTIEDIEIYMPENNSNNKDLVDIAYEVGCDMFGKENVRLNLDWGRRSPGATDMGNVGSVIPTIQPHLISPGCDNHVPEFQVEFPEYAVLYHGAVLAAMACVLLENGGERAKKVISGYTPIFSSIKEYCDEMDKIYRLKKAVEYNDDGSATLTWI